MFIEEYIKKNILTKEKILNDKTLIENIGLISEVIINAYKAGNKVLAAGNGGSAADAQHIAGELVSKFYLNRPGLCAYALTTNSSIITAPWLCAYALNTNSSIITAFSNDYGYENVFAWQINGMGNKGDILICFSTSGESKNIINALKEAKAKGLITIGFTGEKKCLMDNICDYLIKVPSDDTPQIQECHILLGHIVCALTEKGLFEKD